MVSSQRRRLPPPHAAAHRVELRCRGCGYGAVVARQPGRCPMCGSDNWAVRARRDRTGARL
jgi:rubrerythrin